MKSDEPVFRPEDTAFFVYLVTVSVMVTLFHRGIAHWWTYVASHSLAASFMVPWLRFARGRSQPAVRHLRHWYVILVLAIFYEQIDGYILGIHGRYLDHVIADFEFGLLGVHPSVWMERFATPLVTEIMKISYNSYYWIGPVLGLSLYLRGDLIPFRRALFSITTAFFISYIGFYLFPVEGPRYLLSHLYKGPLDGYLVTALQDFIMERGDIRGGCMPSSHVAVALVVLLLAWVYRRRMAYWMTPLVTLLAISTVYNRYHYASDVVAGIAVGLFCFWWGGKVYPKGGEKTISGHGRVGGGQTPEPGGQGKGKQGWRETVKR